MLRSVLYILFICAVFLVLAGLFAVVSSVTSAPMYAGGFDDENEFNRITILSNVGDTQLSSTPTVVDPRAFTKLDWFDSDINMNLRIDFRRCYSPPLSDRQISTLFHRADSSDKARLAQLLGMVPGINPWDQQTYKMKDSDIYSKIRPRAAKTDPRRAVKHAATIYRILKRTLKSAMPEKPTYLDIGCMDGSITSELAKLMGTAAPKCIDPAPRGQTNGVEITTKVDKYPFKNDHFDIVTAIMTLHHIPALEDAIAEIVRVLKPGGYLFIKEHDVWSPADCALVDIEHTLHMTLSGEITPGSLPPNDYYIQYRNFHEFDRLFSALKYVKSSYFHPIDRYLITPTRAYWSIYRKPPVA